MKCSMRIGLQLAFPNFVVVGILDNGAERSSRGRNAETFVVQISRNSLVIHGLSQSVNWALGVELGLMAVGCSPPGIQSAVCPLYPAASQSQKILTGGLS